MKNWGNWSYGELVDVIETAKREGRKSVTISQEHTDYYNDKSVNSWLGDMRLRFENGMERTTIYFD